MKLSTNFSYLEFKELFSLESEELAQKFHLKNNSLNSHQLLQLVWNSCVINKINPLDPTTQNLQLNFELLDLYFTGYPELNFTKSEAFKLTSYILSNYNNEISLNRFLSGRHYPDSPFITQDFNEYNFTCFISLFTAFGLHLKENKNLLHQLLTAIDLPIPERFSESEYFIDTDITPYCQFLNELLFVPRTGKDVDLSLEYSDNLTTIFKNSINSNPKGTKYFSLILGIQQGSLRGNENKPYSSYVLNRFVKFFKLTDKEINDANFTVTLPEELIDKLNNTDDSQYFINPNFTIHKSQVNETLRYLYKLTVQYIGGSFFDSRDIQSTSINRVKNLPSFNYLFRTLEYLDLTNNDALLTKLFDDNFINQSVRSTNIVTSIGEVVEEDVINLEEQNPIEALGYLNCLPQAITLMHKLYSKEEENSITNIYGKSLSRAFIPLSIANAAKKILQESNIDMVAITTQLLSTRDTLFKDEQVISIAIGSYFNLKDESNWQSFIDNVAGKTYVYLSSNFGVSELKLIQYNHIDGKTVFMFYDLAKPSVALFHQDASTFKNFYASASCVHNVLYL